MSEPYDWAAILARTLEEDCLDCDSSPEVVQHTAMPVRRPQSVDPYLESLAGPDEQHQADPESHCDNPKCTFRIGNDPAVENEIQTRGTFDCPECGWHNTVQDAQPFTPGGRTRAGLGLWQMGTIGEEVVFRMGELPGIGAIVEKNPTPDARNPKDPFGKFAAESVDCVVQSSDGRRYGCEIKTNHSQAQERFKIGGAAERQAKIAFCYQHGLKPALVGVRLNFYTNKAYVFFREGLTDTWIGNAKMIHVGTVDFTDLNPFKSPDPQAQALAVDNAQLPDQSEDGDIDAAFGSEGGWNMAAKVAADDFNEEQHPRKSDGQFTFKHDVHELKVISKAGKQTHTAKHCRHCGHLNMVPAEHQGRVECSTCGEDIDRTLRLTKVVIGDGQDPTEQLAYQLGFSSAGRTGRGHRKFIWEDPRGTVHTVVADQGGAHAKGMSGINAAKARNRMLRCQNGQCMHGSSEIVPPVVEPGQPMFRAGQTVAVNGGEQFIMEVDGGLALVLDPHTGKEDVVPTTSLQPVDKITPPSIEDTLVQQQNQMVAAEKKPDYMWVYYMGRLEIDEWHHNRQYVNLLEELLKSAGVDIDKAMMDIDPNDVAAGQIFEFSDGAIRVEHKQLAKEDVRERADSAISDWLREKEDVFGGMDEEDLPDRDPDNGRWMPA